MTATATFLDTTACRGAAAAAAFLHDTVTHCTTPNARTKMAEQGRKVRCGAQTHGAQCGATCAQGPATAKKARLGYGMGRAPRVRCCNTSYTAPSSHPVPRCARCPGTRAACLSPPSACCTGCSTTGGAWASPPWAWRSQPWHCTRWTAARTHGAGNVVHTAHLGGKRTQFTPKHRETWGACVWGCCGW